jgi:hypothetical protein
VLGREDTLRIVESMILGCGEAPHALPRPSSNP